MKLFLTSNIGGIKKVDGKKISIPFFAENEFLYNLKSTIKKYDKFLMIASDPNTIDNNTFFLELIKQAFKLSGLIFKEYEVLDNRNIDNISKVINGSNLIFLSGGDTLIQNKFFNKINLKDYLKDIDTTIVGISAGSINCANNCYNSPECDEDLNNSPYLKGLDLTDINIEPHFVLDDIAEYNKKLQREHLLKESCNRKIIALTDGAYIFNNKVYGESYEIKNGTIVKICNNNEHINIK